jgi:hypothetical protein
VGEGGLNAAEVGQEITEHRRHADEHGGDSRRDRRITIVEAVLLSLVTILAAWSGFASAKWGTEAQLTLARASAARTEASRANLDAMEIRNLDAASFNTWFTAYLSGDQAATNLAEKRFRPEFRVAFEAWMEQDPFTDPSAPPGPTYMKEYRQPGLAASKALDAKADRLYQDGAAAGANADQYVRTTVLLASVLFLVGISGHFRVTTARYGLIALGAIILVVSITIILTSPGPPG